jgi:hypothetical protein
MDLYNDIKIIIILNYLPYTTKRNFVMTCKGNYELLKIINVPIENDERSDLFDIRIRKKMKVSYRYFLEILLDGYVSSVTKNVYNTFKRLEHNDMCRITFGLAKIGNLEMIKFIVTYIGAQKNIKASIINGAASGESIDILEWGLEKNFPCDGKTFVCAVHNNKLGSVQTLLKFGYKPDYRAASIARNINNLKLLSWLSDNGCPMTRDQWHFQ